MLRKLVLLMLGLSLMLTACGNSKSANEALTHIRLPMGYIPNIQYAPFYVAVEKGYFKDAGIEIEFDYKFETDGVALVGAGELPFAVVSGEQVLLARAQGLPVTYVAAWYQQYPEYAANEPLQLRAQGIAVTELRVADYAQLAANGLLASEKVIAEDPELVRAFVGAFLKGLRFTMDNPDEAFEISKAYIPNFSELDANVQQQVLEVSIEQWKAERLGYSDPQAWENMQNVLLDMGLIAEPLDLSNAFTNEFVP